jgi:hypothetical protein
MEEMNRYQKENKDRTNQTHVRWLDVHSKRLVELFHNFDNGSQVEQSIVVQVHPTSVGKFVSQ